MTKIIDISTGATLEDDGVKEPENEPREENPMRDLAEVYSQYIHLLNAELNETSPIAHAHGWRSKRAELGEQAREKIKGTLRKYGL